MTLFEVYGIQGNRSRFVDAESAAVDQLQDSAVTKAPGLGEIWQLKDLMDLVHGEGLLRRALFMRRQGPWIWEGVLKHEAFSVEMMRPELGRVQVDVDGGILVTINVDTKRACVKSLCEGFDMARLKDVWENPLVLKKPPELLDLGDDLSWGCFVTRPEKPAVLFEVWLPLAEPVFKTAHEDDTFGSFS